MLLFCPFITKVWGGLGKWIKPDLEEIIEWAVITPTGKLFHGFTTVTANERRLIIVRIRFFSINGGPLRLALRRKEQ